MTGDGFLFLALAIGLLLAWRQHERRRRIRLLASRLAPFGIERLMEQLTQGYLRCLGEDDAGRRKQQWQWLGEAEQHLARQFARFAADFATVDGRQARFPRHDWLGALWPVGSIDLRELLAVHARGIARTVENAAGLGRRDKAFMLSAELFLMQHSCHWFCRSRATASARLLARHRTAYAQVLAAVSARTRSDYLGLVGPGAAGTAGA